MSDAEDSIVEEGDLFGDEQEEQPERELSDKELDSGDDEGRDDRAGGHMEVDANEDDFTQVRSAQILEIELGRQTVPITPDGQVSLVIQQYVIGINNCRYTHSVYQAFWASIHYHMIVQTSKNRPWITIRTLDRRIFWPLR